MKAKKVTLGGRSVWLSTNNNWELSNNDFDKEYPKIVKDYPELKKDCWKDEEFLELIRKAPRTTRSSHGKPRFIDEAGHPISIGVSFLCAEGEVCNASTSDEAVPEDIWLDVSRFWSELSEGTKQYITKASPKVAQKVAMAQEYGFDSLDAMQAALDALKKKNAAKKA